MQKCHEQTTVNFLLKYHRKLVYFKAMAIYNIQIEEGQLRNITNGVFDTRPIFSQSTIITSPPFNQRGPNRRPIPVITSDWFSTPRSQLSVLSGTYFLSGVEQLEVQRIFDLSTLLGTYNKGNQYRVKVPRAETIFLAIESSTESQRRFLKSSRPFTLNILDPSGETAFTIGKNVGWGCLPGWLHVLSVDETYQMASVIHKWDDRLGDYILLLTFPEEMNIKLKGLLLGATFLIEYVYFEHQ
ncbi:phospholipid scramblase 1-like isoform X2 [Belonocnema kinseyi]|uniref:phospholipid scramblase 1-like isoform X2 n=1 Tax=Belonocnema kinseyi TaxID=2817044 RepID=UPI00143CD90F|nr:phospholipid scramblase 1-like isoform X2 [Belonocnema kinseyi]